MHEAHGTGGVVNSYLVAVRRGTGSVERCPEPVGVVQILAMLRVLKPYQRLEISAVGPPLSEGEYQYQ